MHFDITTDLLYACCKLLFSLIFKIKYKSLYSSKISLFFKINDSYLFLIAFFWLSLGIQMGNAERRERYENKY